MQSLSTNAGEFDSTRGIQPKTTNSQSIILLEPILGQPWNKSINPIGLFNSIQKQYM